MDYNTQKFYNITLNSNSNKSFSENLSHKYKSDLYSNSSFKISKLSTLKIKYKNKEEIEFDLDEINFYQEDTNLLEKKRK